MRDAELVPWLLEGDPAIRWRVLEGLTGAPAKQVARERSLVATQGWGAKLLAAQHDHGGWGEGVYAPKWTSTTYTPAPPALAGPALRPPRRAARM